MRYFSQLEVGSHFIIVNKGIEQCTDVHVLVKVCNEYWLINKDPKASSVNKFEVKVNSLSVHYPAITYHVEASQEVLLVH